MQVFTFIQSLLQKLPRHNTRAMFGLGILVIGLLVTVGLALQSQDTRSRAAENTISCVSFGTDEDTGNITSDELLESDPRQLRDRLRQESQQRREELQKQKEELKKQLDEYKEQGRVELGQARQQREELRESLEQRKEELKKQMRLNPREALERIRDEGMAMKLQQPTQDCVEELVSKEGALQVIHADYESIGESEDIVTLIADNHEVFYLHMTDEIKTNVSNAKRVRVTGYVVDQDILVDGSNASNVTPIAGDVALDEEVFEADSLGTKKVAVILTKNLNKDQITNHYRNVINPYYQQSSYNKMSMAVSVYGPYNVDTSCTARAWDASVRAAMGPAGITESQFDNIQVIGDFSGCGWAGIAFMPGKLSAVKTNYALAMTPAHEMGHNYKADHARFNGLEYGDAYTIMGTSANRGLFNAAHADHLGWFGSNEVRSVTSSGTYTLEPIGSTTGGVKALKLTRPNASPLYVEYRQPILSDVNLRKVGGDNVYTGALFHTVIPKHSWLKTELIDVTPPNDIASSALQFGETYRDPVTGVTFKQIGRTDKQLLIEVGVPGSNAPTPTPNRTVTPTPTRRPSAPTPTPTPRINSNAVVTTSGYLSDKQYVSATIGWGTLRMNRSVEGNQLKLNGKMYTKGIGTHALSTIRYNINNCLRFTAEVGMDDEVTHSKGSVSFQVIADGVMLYNSGTMTTTTTTKRVDVSLSGRKTLTLQVNDGGNGIDYDHADWANAYITCGSNTGGPVPTPTPTRRPTPTPTKPPTGSINLPDLAVTSFELTDQNGVVKTTFKVNEPIYVKVVFANIGNAWAHTSNNHTYSVYHRHRPSAITQYAQPSDPRNFWMDNGEYPANWRKEYGSYSSHPNSFVYRGEKSWTMSAPGTYTARVFMDYDNQVYELNEANNQRTKTYTVVEDEQVNELIRVLQGIL